MKKILLLLPLAMLAAPACADWAKVDYPSQELALYIDRDTLQKSGVGLVQMWHLRDYAAPQDYQGKPFRSIKGQDEYDCEKGVRRDMLYLWHQDGMGASRMVQAAYKPGPWTRPEAGSPDEALIRIACGTR